MMVFWLFAALMLAAALFFVLPPLLSKGQGAHVERDAINLDILRDQLRELDADRAAGSIDGTSYESARHDLEQRVAEEVKPSAAAQASHGAGKPWTAIAVGLLLPALAVGLYFYVGNRDALNPVNLVAQQEPQQKYTAEQVDALVKQIAQHMKENPDDPKGWGILAQTYAKLGRFAEAADAYSHLAKLVPDNADVLTNYANALGLASSNHSLQGEPEKLIKQALAIDGKNINALALSGAVNFERHDYTAAVTQWRKILVLIPPNSDAARSVAANIDQALSLSGMPAEAGAKPVAAAGDASASVSGSADASASVSGSVELDPVLRAKANDNDTVFIFARAVGGPPMPLAVLKKQVKDLPLKFVLDDSMSMMPSAKLSAFQNVVVTARVSKSGTPMPGPGDLEGGTGTIHPGAQGLKIVINTADK